MKCIKTDCKGIDSLRLTNIDAPGDPAPGDVLIDVHAAALNYRDLMVARGHYGGVPPKPFIAVSDMAGVVAKVGEGVTHFKPGDRVVNAPFRNWPAGTLRGDWARTFVGGNGVDGVLAEQISYPAAAIVHLPEHLSFDQGATLTIAGLTAWSAVVTHGHVRAGDWVLVHGTGGVSIFAAQIARLFGAQVILTTSSKGKGDLVKDKLGVDHILDYREDDWPQQIHKLTDGHGADIVVEVVGGKSLSQSIKACGYGGRVNLIGVLDGLDSAVNVRDFLSHQVTVRGIFMESAQELAAFTRAVDANKLEPWIDRVFPFSETIQAYRHLESQTHIGKVIIRVK